MANKVKNLIVDTGAFLRNTALQDIGSNIYTCEEVLAEVKSKWAKDQLQVLPYEIKVKQPDEEDLQFVTRFARKTGDFSSLSDTDLKVIALAVRLERETNGNIDHLKSAPSTAKIISNVPEKQTKNSYNDYGFNFKNKSRNKIEEKNDKEENDNIVIKNEEDKINNDHSYKEEDEEYYSNGTEDDDYNSCEESLDGNEENLDDHEEDSIDEDNDGDFNDYYTSLIKSKDDSNKTELIEEADDEDDGDWITPSNIDQVKQQFDNLKIDEKVRKNNLDTACITGDFSMQNVLMQIGIKVLSVQKGLLIKQARQFVLRCIACCTITTNTSLMFCPSCGNLKTLKKVSVSVDENGQKRIHLNPKRPVTTRDIKLRIPRPRKGKYALNPILVADQHVPKFRQAKFAIQERKQVQESILNDVRYLVRDNPFSINDVYSRSSNYKTGSRAAAINKMVFNEGRKHTKKKSKRRN